MAREVEPNPRLGSSRAVRSLAALALMALSAFGQEARATDPGSPGAIIRPEPLVLTYVANEGVLLTSGETKILVDALFDRPNPEYRAPSAETLDKMMKGIAPFDGVDLVLVTHDHPDHFDAALAAHYLAEVPGPILVAPTDAVREMRNVAADWAKIEPRVKALDMKVGEKAALEPNEIPVMALRTLHSGNREAPMNIMYVFAVNGWRVFHEGDSPGNCAEYRAFGLGGAPIDLALVHFWFPLEPDCARFLQEIIQPDHIALMHLPIRQESTAPDKIEQVRDSYQDLFLLLPGMPAREFRQ